MYVNSLYDSKGLLKNSILKNNICMVDNKDRVMYDKLINSDVLKTIDIKLNNYLNSVDFKKINIFGKFVGKLDKEIYLELSDGINNVSVIGNKPDIALKQPVSRDNILKQLSKLGDTIFNLEKLDIDLDNNLFINIKDLNELRRECINKLILMRSSKVKNDFSINIPNIIKNVSIEPKISVLVRNEDQFNIVIRNNIDIIYTSNISLYNKYKDKYNIYLRLDRVNDLKEEYINERLLCSELGSINK
jgi:putative protease